MTSSTALDDSRLKSLIRSVLLEDRVVKRDDSEQTVENSLQPPTPSPSVDPFTTHWYSSLIPHKVREPFKAPETLPQFFNIRDAQHAALFNPNTAAGGCREADVLYQAIAFLHRILDDILPLIDGQQLVDVWKSVKGVSEMLHTRYDLLCALRRSRDDQHVRCLEMFMQPPSGDGAASARIHREICRAVSRKRPREEVKDLDSPPQARPKTSPSVDVVADRNDEVDVVTPVKHEKPATVKAQTKKDTKEAKTKSRLTKEYSSTPRARSKTMDETPKPKRSSLAETKSSPIVSRTRSSDLTKRLRSSSTLRIKSDVSGAKEGKPASSAKGKEISSAKKISPKRQLAISKKSAPVKKKVESKKKSTSSKPVAADKNSTPKKLPFSTKSQSNTTGTPKNAFAGKKVTSSKNVASPQKGGQSKPPATLKKVSSVKKSDSQNKVVSKNGTKAARAEKKADRKTKAGEEIGANDKVTPGLQVDDASVANMQADDEIEVVHVKLSKKEPPNGEKKVTSENTPTLGVTSGDEAEESLKRVMTNFTFVARGDNAEQMKSPIHTFAGYQWRLVVYPCGDNQKDWMSVYLECSGPEPSQTDKINENSSAIETANTRDTKSDQAWIQARFSVRVLRTDSMVTKAVLQGKDVAIDNDHALLSTSKVNPNRKILEAGLLSDFAGEMSHGFSPSADRVGFSRLAPTSCLAPGMYADEYKNITLVLFMCTE